jgi:hypothetical protein
MYPNQAQTVGIVADVIAIHLPERKGLTVYKYYVEHCS